MVIVYERFLDCEIEVNMYYHKVLVFHYATSIAPTYSHFEDIPETSTKVLLVKK